MAVTYSDIITEESVRREVIEEVRHPLQFRQIFSQMSMENADGDTIQVPKETGEMGQPEEVAYGSEMPRDEGGMEFDEVTMKKFGSSVELWQEAISDSLFNIVSQNVEKQSRRMNEFLDYKAYDYLSQNNHSTTAGGEGDGLDFDSILSAKKILQDEGYSPDFLITSSQGEKDLMTSEEFTRATDMADETVRTGQVGQVSGLDVVSDTSGHLPSDSSTAFMVDTSEYGWEFVKANVMTNSFEDDDTHSMVYQIWTRRNWYTPREDAAVRIEG